jgi:hypothetical protein
MKRAKSVREQIGNMMARVEVDLCSIGEEVDSDSTVGSASAHVTHIYFAVCLVYALHISHGHTASLLITGGSQGHNKWLFLQHVAA